jgi:hypothetical protein
MIGGNFRSGWSRTRLVIGGTKGIVDVPVGKVVGGDERSGWLVQRPGLAGVEGVRGGRGDVRDRVVVVRLAHGRDTAFWPDAFTGFDRNSFCCRRRG